MRREALLLPQCIQEPTHKASNVSRVNPIKGDYFLLHFFAHTGQDPKWKTQTPLI